MRFTQKCPICGSTKIKGPHHVRSQQIILPNGRTASLNSLTCLKCGYTQVYADIVGMKNVENGGRDYELPDMENEYCPSCGANFHEGSRRCSKCGLIDITDKDMKEFEKLSRLSSCQNCGLLLKEGAQKCPACGWVASKEKFF